MSRVVLLAGVAAVAVPALALLPRGSPPPRSASAPFVPLPVPDPPARRLFAAAPETALALPGGDVAAPDPALPDLVGVAGRLPDDAVALVRTASGRTHSLGVGDVYDGWRLEGLSANAALFTRDGTRRRVALPDDTTPR